MAVYLKLLVTSLIVTCSESISCTENRFKLIIDEDAGADDAMAIFMAIIYEKHLCGPELVGLTTTHGNVDESQAFLNTQRIINAAGRRDIPIFRGAKRSILKDEPSDHHYGLDGLGDNDVGKDFEAITAKPTQATIALLDLSHKYEGLLQVVCMGTLTNVALAIRLDPEFINRVAHIYIGAGNIRSERYPRPEFNAFHDVEAYKLLVQDARPDKVTMIPFTTIREYMNTTKAWRKEVLGSIPTTIMKTQNAFEAVSWASNTTYWRELDPAVVAILLNEKLVTEDEFSLNDIVLCGEDRGINTNSFVAKEDANVHIVTRINESLYTQFLIDVFSLS